MTPNTESCSPANRISTVKVIIKALALFSILNLFFALITPLPVLGRISAYNLLFPGRARLPYGDNPTRAYNLSLNNLEAMFASHQIAGAPKPKDEYRVVLIGDSSTWGFLLPPGQTLAGQINQQSYLTADGRRVRAYNLGYPVMSLTKDLVILSYALRYQPDMIVWLVTLESFPNSKQLYPPLLQNNLPAVRELDHAYHLQLDLTGEESPPQAAAQYYWGETIVGKRRALADLVRLQLYGVMWAATGIDQYIPATYTPRMEDLPADERFHEYKPPHLRVSDLAFQVIEAGMEMAAPLPILLINEPIFISQGENSALRYNFYYPRWAYDDYRQMMAEFSARSGWNYHDLWDVIPGEDFTNTAVHLSPRGTAALAQITSRAILQTALTTARPGVKAINKLEP